LLHGYPSSSHTYRELIPLLSGRYHIIAPDNLGSGYSDKPDPDDTVYTFDLLAKYVHGLVVTLGIEKYSIYMQDFGAPVGFRLMMMAPEKVSAIIVQNANAYLEGIPEAKQIFFRNANLDKSPENVEKLYEFTSADAVKYKQYLRDVKGKEQTMSPDSWTFDSYFLQTDKESKIQVALFQDYKSNLDAYTEWQEFLRKYQFPTLIVWGKNDPIFMASGAKAYLRDIPNAQLHLLDAGHFAVEEKPVEIAKLIIEFMDQQRNID
jgi:pimeloyl-ACP methyl ester carboxylesterase